MRPKIDLAASGRFSGAVQIADVRLVSSFFASEFKAPDLTNFHTEFLAEVNELRDDELVLTISFRLTDHEADEEDQDGDEDETPPALSAFADFEVTYDILKPVDSEDAESFAWINGVMNAWSYWRSLVHNMLAQMGQPRLIVPVFRVENEAIGRAVPPAAQPAPSTKGPAKKAPSKRAPAKKLA
jgi:hypothetical protein